MTKVMDEEAIRVLLIQTVNACDDVKVHVQKYLRASRNGRKLSAENIADLSVALMHLSVHIDGLDEAVMSIEERD